MFTFCLARRVVIICGKSVDITLHFTLGNTLSVWNRLNSLCRRIAGRDRRILQNVMRKCRNQRIIRMWRRTVPYKRCIRTDHSLATKHTRRCLSLRIHRWGAAVSALAICVCVRVWCVCVDVCGHICVWSTHDARGMYQKVIGMALKINPKYIGLIVGCRLSMGFALQLKFYKCWWFQTQLWKYKRHILDQILAARAVCVWVMLLWLVVFSIYVDVNLYMAKKHHVCDIFWSYDLHTYKHSIAAHHHHCAKPHGAHCERVCVCVCAYMNGVPRWATNLCLLSVAPVE